MWLFEEEMRDVGMRDRTKVEYWVPGGAMFGIKKYGDILEELRKARDVQASFKQELVAIDAGRRVATFKSLETGQTSEQKYDLLHVVPPMSAPDFIKQSPLADPVTGWMDVDRNTLQSKKYSNVYGLGDCTNTPNSKTAAAITKQAPILVHNLMQTMSGKAPTAKYNGYASCPLVIGKNQVVLAEFGYDGVIMESFCNKNGKFPMNLLGQDNALAKRVFMFLKTGMFPFSYWHLWPIARWYGTTGPFKPDFDE